MNDITAHAVLIGASLAFTLVNTFINIKATATPTRLATMAGIYGGLGLALATLVKMTSEVWS